MVLFIAITILLYKIILYGKPAVIAFVLLRIACVLVTKKYLNIIF